jgi:hypothetical protein
MPQRRGFFFVIAVGFIASFRSRHRVMAICVESFFVSNLAVSARSGFDRWVKVLARRVCLE